LPKEYQLLVTEAAIAAKIGGLGACQSPEFHMTVRQTPQSARALAR
jgi:hypothetical protein